VDPELLPAFRRRVLEVIQADLDREAAEAEALRAELLPKVGEAVRAARAGGRCGRVWLFGSFAWGRPGGRSDVDLLVEGCADPDALAAEIWRAVDRPVHVLQAPEAPESLVERARREGCPL
jgi:predicted nucleotidyltransferase